MGNAVFLHHFLIVQYLELITAVFGFIDKYMLLRQLSVILVRSHHINVKLIFIRLFGQGSDYIVSFEAFLFKHRYVVGFQDFFDEGD
ncbi:hypothetical protein SDC9_99124 [bioreactor metagenome]|uniref:Uncharacterized protein n=1 Tax=bioreactor metagenome TaxID=1076179 RepID=A0A645AGP4_9ZZZZ